MRLWTADPSRMCRRHLLGEHVETHMMAGCLAAGRSLGGYYARGLIDTDLIAPRHAALAAEMAARGYRHESPLPDFPNPRRGRVAPASPEERCGRCRERAASGRIRPVFGESAAVPASRSAA